MAVKFGKVLRQEMAGRNPLLQMLRSGERLRPSDLPEASDATDLPVPPLDFPVPPPLFTPEEEAELERWLTDAVR